MRILFKLTFGFVLISLLVGIQAYIGYMGAISIQEQYEEVSEQTLPILENLNTIRISGIKITESTDEIIQVSSSDNNYINSEIDEIAEYSNIYNRSFEIYENTVNTYFPEEIEILYNINDSMNDILRISSEIVYLKKNVNNKSQIAEKKLEFDKSEQDFTEIIDFALNKEKAELKERTEQTENVMNNLRTNSLNFGLLSFFIALVMGYFFSHRISSPIVKLKNASYEISNGNLDTKIEINTKDELGGLGKTFNQMTNNLKKSLNETNIAIKEQKVLNEKITRSLEEKEVLLREIHHRVKNNMQIVSSLLMLQSQNIEDKKYKDIFIDSQNRIQAMALIHQKIYQSASLAQINLKEYINGVVSNIFESYGKKNNIKLDINMDEIQIKIDYAVPCGLIINELVTNSFKYAFPDGRSGTIKISGKSYDNDMIQLSISDDGIGIAKDMDIRKTDSLGLQLVTNLAESQLHGQIILNRETGTEFQINFRQVK